MPRLLTMPIKVGIDEELPQERKVINMEKIILTLKLMPEEVRIIRSALSRDIINYWKDDSMNVEIDESIQVYKKIARVSDEQYSGWLRPNPELKKILDIS